MIAVIALSPGDASIVPHKKSSVISRMVLRVVGSVYPTFFD